MHLPMSQKSAHLFTCNPYYKLIAKTTFPAKEEGEPGKGGQQGTRPRAGQLGRLASRGLPTSRITTTLTKHPNGDNCHAGSMTMRVSPSKTPIRTADDHVYYGPKKGSAKAAAMAAKLPDGINSKCRSAEPARRKLNGAADTAAATIATVM
eukprot:1179209-Prorocentrum_minimum.AAC.3